MLTCDTCEKLKEITVTSYGKSITTNCCGRIPVNDLSQHVTTFDEDGEHPYIIINNPYMWGCIYHPKMDTYYKRITTEDKIPNDPRIKVK